MNSKFRFRIRWSTVIIWFSAGIVLYLIVHFVLPFVVIFVNVGRQVRAIRKTEAQLSLPAVYNPVARRLALYCQSDRNLIPENISSAWFPAEMGAFPYGYGQINSKDADIELGGGFYHFGYSLTLDPSRSTAATNVWELEQLGEGKPPIKLTTLELAVTNCIQPDELYKLISAGFGKNIGGEDGYKGNVVLALRFGKTNEAVSLCKQWIKTAPDTWLPRFTYAHVRCRVGECSAAAGEFKDWVQVHKNFSRCTYLALFFLREGNTNEALQAVRLCLDQPLVDAPDQDRNNPCLGYNGGLIAFMGGDYDLVLQICAKLEPFLRTEPYFIRQFAMLKAAALAMKANPEANAAMKIASANTKSDSFSGPKQRKSNSEIEQAINQKNVNFLRNPRNWVDENESWYSPFETDEIGIHGAKVRNPYPTTWTNDVIRLCDSQ